MASESAIGSVIGNSVFSRSLVTELVAIHVHCAQIMWDHLWFAGV